MSASPHAQAEKNVRFDLCIFIGTSKFDEFVSCMDQNAYPVNGVDQDVETLLRRISGMAFSPERLEIARLLISRGADPEIQMVDSSRALSRAAEVGNIEVARLLLDSGARVDAFGEGGRTALHNAICPAGSCPGMTKLLLDFGASTAEMMTYCSDLPLNIATTRLNKDAVVALMASGEDPRISSPLTGLTALHIAETMAYPGKEPILPVMRAMLDARIAEEAIDGLMKRSMNP